MAFDEDEVLVPDDVVGGDVVVVPEFSVRRDCRCCCSSVLLLMCIALHSPIRGKVCFASSLKERYF